MIMTQVWIYEDGERLYGTIIKEENGEYTVEWDDGETTQESVKEFDPAGWAEGSEES